MPVRKQILRVARLLPVVVAVALLPAILLGLSSGCGKGIFSQVTSSASPTGTPGTGAFLYASNFNDGKIAAFKRNTTKGTL